MPDTKAFVRTSVETIVARDIARAPWRLATGTSHLSADMKTLAAVFAQDGVSRSEVHAAHALLKKATKDSDKAFAEVQKLRDAGAVDSDGYRDRLRASNYAVLEAYAYERLEAELVALR